MTAYVEQLGRRDELAELIEWHFQIIRVFLPDDQSSGARSRAGPVVGFHIHRRLLLSGFETESRGKNAQIRARLIQKISTAIASAAEISDSARDCGIWITSSRSIARRVRSKAKLLRAMMAIPIATIASPAYRVATATTAPASCAGRWGMLPPPTASTKTFSLMRKNPNAATAKPVRIQARKVRSFAAWFV